MNKIWIDWTRFPNSGAVSFLSMAVAIPCGMISVVISGMYLVPLGLLPVVPWNALPRATAGLFIFVAVVFTVAMGIHAVALWFSSYRIRRYVRRMVGRTVCFYGVDLDNLLATSENTPEVGAVEPGSRWHVEYGQFRIDGIHNGEVVLDYFDVYRKSGKPIRLNGARVSCKIGSFFDFLLRVQRHNKRLARLGMKK